MFRDVVCVLALWYGSILSSPQETKHFLLSIPKCTFLAHFPFIKLCPIYKKVWYLLTDGRLFDSYLGQRKLALILTPLHSLRIGNQLPDTHQNKDGLTILFIVPKYCLQEVHHLIRNLKGSTTCDLCGFKQKEVVLGMTVFVL